MSSCKHKGFYVWAVENHQENISNMYVCFYSDSYTQYTPITALEYPTINTFSSVWGKTAIYSLEAK